MERTTNLDVTLAADPPPRQQLVEVLERYMADLERGVEPDQQALLAAHPDLAGELRPYLESLRLLNGATRDMRAAKGAAGGAEAAPARRIGEYRIVREIGRGGMGIVYEAHQESLNRQVALKVLPFAAVLDQRQIARFRNEAQAAAQLHHPHIVPVFAVGQEQGVYYYAMQYIAGQTLDRAIADLRVSNTRPTANSTKARGAPNGSTTTLHFGTGTALARHYPFERADFFRTVARLGREAAEALQHAHEHGIIHRDVKPSNLLIDGLGKLWVTDFGLARIQTENGVTLTGDVIGTLRYMSPEQASGSAIVDVRTDVYSLGVTLYELITQSLAHPSDDRQKLLRQIIEEEPIPPRRLNPAVPMDLETIVLGAMAKSRDDRYASAQALADDLGRFLDGKPTLARRPTVVDRMAKWARRHRPLVTVAACAVVLLGLVSAVGMVLLAREQARTSAALVDAQENFKRAERHYQQALGAVDHFGVKQSDRLIEIPGAEPVRRDLLLETLGYYRQFANDAGNDPKLRQETALAHFKSAVIAAKLGAVNDAIDEYKSSQRLFADLVKGDSNLVEPQSQLALAHNNLGLLYAARSEGKLALQEYANAVAIQQRLVHEHADDPALAGELAESQANLGLLFDQLGDPDAAEKSLLAAVEVLRRLANSQAGQPKATHNLAIACNNLSFVLRNRDADAADKAAREAIEILERLALQPGRDNDSEDDLALCYNNLAALESHKHDWNSAIVSHERAIELQEQMVRKSPAVVRHRSDLAISLNNLGVVCCRAGKVTEADAAFGRARELFAELAKDYPDELSYRSSLAAQLNNQALALAGMGHHAESLPIYRAAIEAQQACRKQATDSDTLRDALSRMYYNYGQSLRAESQWREATDVALTRRDLWKGNGERLLGVAVELAELDSEMKPASGAEAKNVTTRELDEAVLTTLQQAYESGWPRTVDLLTEDRFASLKKNERFAAKVAEFNQRSVQSAEKQLPNHDSPHAKTN